MRSFLIIISIVIPLALASSAIAQSAVDLGDIEVKDSPVKKDEPLRDSTASADVIRPEESKDLNMSVPELLEQSAGVNIKRYGGLDDFSAISLRGSTAAQVQIYLDDIPLATSQGELIDLSIVPLDIIDRIEVYRGGSPGTVPDSAAGGVVILHTKKRPEKFELTLRNLAGSFFTYKGTASAADTFGKVSFAAAYERSQSEGNFKFIDNNGTTFNPSDDTVATRENNDFASNSIYTKAGLDVGGVSLSFSNTFFDKDQGIPGLGNHQSTNARLKMQRELLSIAADKDFDSVKGLSLHGDVFFDFFNSRFTDPNGEIGLGVQDNDDYTYRFGENVRAGYMLGKHQQLGGFVAHRAEFFLPTNWAATPAHGAQSHRNTITAGAEDSITFFSDRLTILPSIRLTNIFNDLTNQDPSIASATSQKNSRSDHQVSAKVGLSLRLVSDLYFKGNFYRGFRNPTFSELFGDRGTIVGNPNLIPEEAINMDAGLAYKIGEESKLGAGIEAAYYRNSVNHLIQFLQTSQSTIQAQNMNDAVIQGMELKAKVAWKKRLSAYASYTYQNAKDTGNLPATSGKFLPGRPKDELASGIIWSEAWLKWFSTRLSAELNYMSGNYLDTQNLLSVNHRTLIALGFASVFCKMITLSFAVKNLTNERISDLVGYPLPGRSYWAVAEFKL